MAGIDTMHVGMLGGYYPEGESEEETLAAIDICQNWGRTACLSCGMNPVLALEIPETVTGVVLCVVELSPSSQ